MLAAPVAEISSAGCGSKVDEMFCGTAKMEGWRPRRVTSRAECNGSRPIQVNEPLKACLEKRYPLTFHHLIHLFSYPLTTDLRNNCSLPSRTRQEATTMGT